MTQVFSPQKWLIIPLEIVERELEGKLLVCAEAMRRGWGCIVGTKRAVRDATAYLPPGAVFLKSVIVSELPVMNEYRAHGHRLGCLDEEGLIQNTLEHMVTLRSTPETLAALDSFMLWGKVQEAAYRQAYPGSDKFAVVSNPRVDLWQRKKYHALYDKEVQHIRAQYGNYFIIPTSFASYNHFMGRDGAMSIMKVDKMVTDKDIEFLSEYELYVKKIYEGFVDIIGPLSAAFPDMNIVIRPHPSENRAPWDLLAAQYQNVHVAFEGGVTPWLLGAKAILHCGSTTAVEGHLLGVPVISYCRGGYNAVYDLEVPQRVSINVETEEDVLRILRAVRAGQDVNAQYPDVAAGHEWLKGWIDGVDSYESAPRIMDVFEAMGVEARSFDAGALPPETAQGATMKERVWDALGFLEEMPSVIERLPPRVRQAIKSRRYGKSKTKTVEVAMVRDYVARLRTMDGGREAEVTALRRNLIALR